MLSAAFERLRAGGSRRLILDLSGLEFMDSSGLRCILDHDAELRQKGVKLVLVPGPPAVQRVFEITHTKAHLSFADSSPWSAQRRRSLRHSAGSWHGDGAASP